MSQPLPLPEASAVTNLFSDLMGDSVTANSIEPPSSIEYAIGGVWTTDDGVASSVCLMDLEISSSLGTFLTRIPKGWFRRF